MLQRSGYDAIDVDNVHYHGSMYGNSLTQTCRIGYQQAMLMEDMYISFYANTEYFNETTNATARQNFLIPINISNMLTGSLPLRVFDEVQNNYRFVSSLVVQVGSTSSGNIVYPNIWASYSEPFTTAVQSPNNIYDLTAYGFTNLTRAKLSG